MYSGKEQFYREILYVIYFLSFIIHGNWMILYAKERKFDRTLTVLVFNCIYSSLVIISTMIRSVLVYNELIKQFVSWLDSIYGIDQYLYYPKERELHPPGMYILLNFYQDGSKFFIANLNFRVQSRAESEMILFGAAIDFVGN